MFEISAAGYENFTRKLTASLNCEKFLKSDFYDSYRLRGWNDCKDTRCELFSAQLIQVLLRRIIIRDGLKLCMALRENFFKK